MSGQHLERPLGSDHSADSSEDLRASTKDGDVSAAWTIAFVVCVLLALVSPFL